MTTSDRGDVMIEQGERKELRQRILLARTPTIATEDALTVARLHDLVIEWALAKRAYVKHPHATELLRLREAEYVLDDVAGIED